MSYTVKSGELVGVKQDLNEVDMVLNIHMEQIAKLSNAFDKLVARLNPVLPAAGAEIDRAASAPVEGKIMCPLARTIDFRTDEIVELISRVTRVTNDLRI